MGATRLALRLAGKGTKAAIRAVTAGGGDAEQIDASNGRQRWGGVWVLAGAAIACTLFPLYLLALPLAWWAGGALALRIPRSKGLTISSNTFIRELAARRALAIVLGAGGSAAILGRAYIDGAGPLLGIAGIIAILVLAGSVASSWARKTLRQMELREKYANVLAAVLQVPASAFERSILDDRGGVFQVIGTPPGAALRLDSLEERLALAWPEWAVDGSRTTHSNLVLVPSGVDVRDRRELLRETDGMIEAIERHARPAERTVAVPAPFTGTVAELAKAHRGIARALGDGWQIEEVEGAELHLASGTADPRPSAETWTLPAGTSPASAARYAALAESRGTTLVEWAPYERRAVVARITPAARTLRDRIAPDLKADPWDVEVRLGYGVTEGGAGYVAGLDVLRGRRPVTDPRRRRDEWMALVDVMCPAPKDYLWTYREDGLTGAVSFECKADPLKANIPFTQDPTTSVEPDEPWFVGVDEFGEDVLIDFAGSAHLMVAGTTRSGKSVCTYGALTHVIRMGASARLLVADPNDTTIAPFEGLVSWSTSSTHPDDVTAMLRWLRAEMDRRKPILREMRRDKIEKFSPELPLLVAVIDEAANYMTHLDANAAKEMKQELGAVVAQGAKYGVRVILITQRPDSQILPTSTRSLLSGRICFRVDDNPTAVMAFPDIEDPSILVTCSPGVGAVRQVGEPAPRRFRSVYLSDHWGVADQIPNPMPKINVNDLGGVTLRPAKEDLTKEQLAELDLGTLELSQDDLVEDMGELEFSLDDFDEDAA